MTIFHVNAKQLEWTENNQSEAETVACACTLVAACTSSAATAEVFHSAWFDLTLWMFLDLRQQKDASGIKANSTTPRQL